MKKLIFLLFIFLVAGVRASPVIESVSINPDELWLEDGVITDTPSISLTRSDNETDVHCFSNITFPDGTLFSELELEEYPPKYHELDMAPIYPYLKELGLEGNYNIVLFCFNNLGDISNILESNFYVYDIRTDLTVSKNPSYLGDKLEIIFNLWVNDDRIKQENLGNFEIIIDGENWDSDFENLVYSPTKNGYFLSIENLEKGEHTLKLSTEYKAKTIITDPIEITVEDPIQFNILNLKDNTEIKKGENLTIKINAFDENNENFKLKKEYLTFEIDSNYVDSDYFSILDKGNDYYDISLKLPSISGGRHELEITFDYNDFPVIRETKEILCSLKLSGQVLNHNDDPLGVEFTFTSNNFERKISTLKNGSYQGFLPPGVYDTEITFPHTTVKLDNLDLDADEFSDPFNYHFFDDFDLGGIRAASLYFIDISPDFLDGTFDMYYNSKYVSNENELNVYKCDNWDSDDNICEDTWEEIDFELNEKDNRVEIDASGNGAYAIGNRKTLDPSFSLDKKSYYLGDLITINGVIRDNIHENVGNAVVTAKIEETDEEVNVESSSKGIVSIEMSAPDKEGNYTLSLSVSKDPYDDFNSEIELQIIEKEELSIVAPQAIRIKQGETSSVEVSIVNIGQALISNIGFSIDGIPEDYYFSKSRIDHINAGEEEKMKIDFYIPENSTEGTFSGKFIINYGNKKEEEIFGFTILPKSEEKEETNKEENGSSIPTGKITLPEFSMPDLNLLKYIIPFSGLAFLGAFLFKKINWKKSESNEEIKKIFTEIKKQIRPETVKNDI